MSAAFVKQSFLSPNCVRPTDKAEVAIGRQVIVIGGGMTAVDAVQVKNSGARARMTIFIAVVKSATKASQVEIDWARSNGVSIRHWAAPKAHRRRARSSARHNLRGHARTRWQTRRVR